MTALPDTAKTFDDLPGIECTTHVLILQHPAESSEKLSTGSLTHRILPNSTLRVGLSWPNLRKALQQPDADHREWGVLFLGTKRSRPMPIIAGPAIHAVKRSGELYEVPALKGIVVLDGSWPQAKTMWWRNAWFLKLHRLMLTPDRKSAYGEKRRQPGAKNLSTIEAVGLSLALLERRDSIRDEMDRIFSEFLSGHTAASSS